MGTSNAQRQAEARVRRRMELRLLTIALRASLEAHCAKTRLALLETLPRNLRELLAFPDDPMRLDNPYKRWQWNPKYPSGTILDADAYPAWCAGVVASREQREEVALARRKALTPWRFNGADDTHAASQALNVEPTTDTSEGDYAEGAA